MGEEGEEEDVERYTCAIFNFDIPSRRHHKMNECNKKDAKDGYAN